MDNKTTFQAVIDEVAKTSELAHAELEGAILGVVRHLRDRAKHAIDSLSDAEALACAQQFLAVTELINHYGTALIAFDDIESETLLN